LFWDGQRPAVIVREKLLKRDRTCSNSVRRIVLSEQLDSYAPERCTLTDNPHRSA
jgi:hypothetical protein